jgi:hypothetical protein
MAFSVFIPVTGSDKHTPIVRLEKSKTTPKVFTTFDSVFFEALREDINCIIQLISKIETRKKI